MFHTELEGTIPQLHIYMTTLHNLNPKRSKKYMLSAQTLNYVFKITTINQRKCEFNVYITNCEILTSVGTDFNYINILN